MKCPNCQKEMVLSPNVLLSEPPKYQYECPDCCQPPIVVDFPELKFTSTFKSAFKLDWSKVKDFNELLWLLNEVDLHVGNSHPKYDELKERFS